MVRLVELLFRGSISREVHFTLLYGLVELI